ncbi:MAG: ATP-binding protein [Rhodospirillaceae bacterium]|nr:ATP-binding protein [Rhodospirillaceae bacterium]
MRRQRYDQPKPFLTPSLEDELRIERLLAVSQHQPLAGIAHFLNASVLAVACWSAAEPWFLMAAMALFAVGVALQLKAWWRSRKRARPRAVSDRTLRRVVWWAAAFGLLWGAYTAGLMLQLQSTELMILVCMVIAGLSAGGLVMLYPLPAAHAVFQAAIVAPPWAVVVWRGTMIDYVLAVYTLIYASFLFFSAHQAHKNFVTGVELRLQNLTLAYKAEAANRAKSRFLANMSHELRTPLNAIIGFAEVIQQQFKGPVGNPQYLEFAKAILDSGKHLVGLIDDVLDISKIEAGRVTLDLRATTPQSILDGVLTLTKSAVARAQIMLETAVEPDLPDILVDERKMIQALVNLVSNAAKFTPAGGRIRLEARRNGGGGLTFLVNDTGAGIPHDEIKDVLKPFIQSREAERRQVQGTGLGLPLTEELVKLHGGTLTLTSTPGEGTTVTITLPPERMVAAARQKVANAG